MAIAQQAQEPNRRQPKKVGRNKQAHTANTPFGMGDHYGQGVRNPVGKARDIMGNGPIPKSKMKKPPRNLA